VDAPLSQLVFLTHRINTRASNWDFEKKKRQYFSSNDGSSPFVITQGVLQTDSWSVEHLKERQKNLLAALAKVWRLTPAAPGDAPEEEEIEEGQRKFDPKRVLLINAFFAHSQAGAASDFRNKL
jgi:hypothetical protein